MKVFIISSIPENLGDITGGVESVTINLLYAFSHTDLEVTVLSFRKDVKKFYIRKLANNVNIYYHPYKFIKSNKIFFILFGRNIVHKFVNELNPDIIHLQGNGSSLILIKNLINRNIVITPHADLKGEYFNLLKFKDKVNHKMVMYIENFAMRKSFNVIFISEYLKRLYQLHGRNEQIMGNEVIYNPVNPMFFDVRDNNVINRFNILYIGEITKRKGLIILLDSLNTLKQKGIKYHLNIVGDYKDNLYKEMINSFIKKNNLENLVTFYGWVSQRKIVDLMEQNGLFILPSYQESLPMSIIEAMSCGKLVIANDTGGISEIINNEVTGYIYKNNSSTQLAAILEYLNSSPSTFLNISHSARNFAKNNFDPKIISQKTCSFYSSVSNQKITQKPKAYEFKC